MSLISQYPALPTHFVKLMERYQKLFTESKVKDFVTKREMPWPQLYEGKFWSTSLGEQYDVSSIPFVLLIDGSTGEILATREKLRGPGLADFIGEVLSKR